MKYVISVVGESGAGKGTFSTEFKKLAKGKTVSIVRFSDILYKTLEIWDLPTTRVNLQALPIAMVKEFGHGTLTHAVSIYIKNQKADIVIVEGLRWLSDLPMIRSFPQNFLVYITADKKIRFARMKARHEKANEDKMTYKDFLLEEKAKTERYIKKIGQTADLKLVNNGDLSDLRSQIKAFYKRIG